MQFFRKHNKRVSALMVAMTVATSVLTPLADAAQYFRVPLNPDGVTPGPGTVQVSPGSIAFADQYIDTTSAPQVVTLSNVGSTDVSVAPLSISGPFAAHTTCDGVLAATATCSYSVTYTADAMGAETGALVIPTSAGNQTIALSGFGLQTSDTASIGSLSFQQPVGTTSSAKTVTLTNTGNTPVTVSGVTVSGDTFNVTHDCPASLAAGTSCDANVTFSPTAMGAANGSLSFNTGAGQQLVVLSGTGLLAVPQLSTTSLSFANQAINTTSTTQTVTLSNKGNTPLGISPATAEAPFVLESDNCPASLDGGLSCTMTVAFAPSAMGAATGTLHVPLSTGNLAVSLGGTGLQTSGAISGNALDFGNVNVGTTSAAQGVTLSNTGNTPLVISSITGTTAFAVTNNCGSAVAVGSNCNVNATFNPTVMGAASGTITVATNGGTYTVNLTAVGLQAKPGFAPVSVTFPGQMLGSTSSAQTVTLINNGNTATALSPLQITGPFAATTTCGASLAANASCTYSVTFTPTAMNGASGTLTVPTDAGVQTVALSGTGLQTSGSIGIGSLPFGNQAVNTTSSAQSVTVTNTGNTPLGISGISSTGQFNTTHNCPSSVAVGASCTVNVVFGPTTMGSQTGVLTVATSGGTYTANLSGTGLLAVASVSPTSLSFGNVAVGASSTTQSVTLSNTGNTPMAVSAPTGTLTQFSFTTNCGTSLSGGASCTYTVTFNAKSQGAANESLTINTSVGNTAVVLTGTGTQAVLTSNPTALTFGNVQLGQTAAKTFTLKNTGNLATSTLVLTPPAGFSQANNCGTSLAAGASCTVTVTFAPTVTSPAYSGSLSVTAGNASTSVTLSGTGTAQSLTNMTGTNINMGGNLPANSSSGQNFVFQNTGFGPVTVGTNSVSGNVTTYTGGTIGDGTCNNGTVLTPGQSCLLYVYVGGVGSYSGTVTLNSSAGAQSFYTYATAVGPTFSATNLGSIKANTTNAIWVTLTNPAKDTLRGMSLAASWPYSLSQSNCGTTLAPGAACSFVVTFNPQNNVGTWNGNYVSVTGYYYQMNSGTEVTGWTPGSVAYYDYTYGTGTAFCTPGAAAWGGPSTSTFNPAASAPGCTTFLVLVVGGGAGGSSGGGGGGGGGAGYVNVQYANGISSPLTVTVGGGGGGSPATTGSGLSTGGAFGYAGGTSCFGSICAGGGAPSSSGGLGGNGGSGGGYGVNDQVGSYFTFYAGAGGSNGSNGAGMTFSATGGAGQGAYASALALFHLYTVSPGAGGAAGGNCGASSYCAPYMCGAGGGGGGGVLWSGGWPSGAGGATPYQPGGGGQGWGGGGGGAPDYTNTQNLVYYPGGGAGAPGIVYVEWSQ